MRGRDIKRYSYEWAHLCPTHNGYGDTQRININDYPAIKEHLDSHWAEISTRSDKGDTPYNLRNCAYMDDKVDSPHLPLLISNWQLKTGTGNIGYWQHFSLPLYGNITSTVKNRNVELPPSS